MTSAASKCRFYCFYVEKVMKKKFVSSRIYRIGNIECRENADNSLQSVENNQFFLQQPSHNLHLISEYDAGMETIFDTSTSNVDLPVCNTIFKKAAFGKKFKFIKVTMVFSLKLKLNLLVALPCITSHSKKLNNWLWHHLFLSIQKYHATANLFFIHKYFIGG